MTVSYPHRVNIVRQAENGPEDELGRAQLWDEQVLEASAWVQPRSVREMEAFSERGVVVGQYVIFVQGATVREADYLVTLGVGGQTEGQVHRVLGVRDPDGMGHHLEVETKLVTQVGA